MTKSRKPTKFELQNPGQLALSDVRDERGRVIRQVIDRADATAYLPFYVLDQIADPAGDHPTSEVTDNQLILRDMARTVVYEIEGYPEENREHPGVAFLRLVSDTTESN